MDEYTAGRPSILLVDGDPARASHRCARLSAHGWHVVNVADPREAMRVVGAGGIDLTILQADPAKAAAKDLPRQLQQQAGRRFLPIIILHERRATEQDRCRCLNSGADEILHTSIGQDELWARMKALLRIKHLQDALDGSRRALQDALRREHQLLDDLRADNDRLTKLTVTDPLTRLYNVRYFHEFLGDEMKIARRYGHPLALLMLDLDHFKMVNDQYGHPAGDYVLKEFSVLLRQSVRESDVVARTGGEEFAVILPRADRAEADEFSRRIRQTVAEHPFEIGQVRIKITCSIGQSCFGQDFDVTGPKELVCFADQALLAAKQSGRNCVAHWFELDSATKTRARTQLRGAKTGPTDAATADVK